MDLVTSADVGSVAISRMVRDGVVTSLSLDVAAPLDLPITAQDRASCLRGVVPTHTVVSGLTGLWVHLDGFRPIVVDLVGLRGLHRAPPGSDPPGWRIRFHSGPAASEPGLSLAGVRIAAVERCVADGLRWAGLGEAIAAAFRAVTSGSVDSDAVSALVRATDPRGLGAMRMASAWHAIEEALELAPPSSAS